MIKWLRRHRDELNAKQHRMIWLPIINEKCYKYHCVLAPSKEEFLLDYATRNPYKRSTKQLVEDIDHHIRLGLEQPQCWVKYLID